MRRTCLALSVAFAFWMPALALAQPSAPPNSKELNETATIEQVLPGGAGLQVKVNNDVWLLRVDQATKVHITGTAEASWLHPKLHAQFSSDLDKKWAAQEPIKEVEVFTPVGKTALGLFDGGDKPVRNPQPGTFTVKGKVVSLKDNELTVSAGGKKISGKLAEDVQINVSVSDAADINYAQEGDSVKVQAWYFPPQGPQAGRPGSATATELSVKLTKPLVSTKKKAPAKPTKPTKASKEAKEKDAPLVSDPFGVDSKPAK